MTTTYDKKTIADYTLNFTTPKAESKFSLDEFKKIFGDISNTHDITDPNFKKAIDFLIDTIQQSKPPIEVKYDNQYVRRSFDSTEEKQEYPKPDVAAAIAASKSSDKNENALVNEEQRDRQEYPTQVAVTAAIAAANLENVEEEEEDEEEEEEKDPTQVAVTAAIAASKSSYKDGNVNNQGTTISNNTVPVVNGQKERQEKIQGDDKNTENTANAPEPPTKIDGGETVTYITPQKLVYIYNKHTGTIYEYEESLENKEDNLREVKLEGENTFQIKIGDKFETINENNVEEHYKFVTENNEITKIFLRDMLNASTAVLKDIKNLFSN
jgi:hypothetical protein